MIPLNGASKQKRGTVSDEAVESLRQLCKEHLDLELNEEEARESATALLNLYRAVYGTGSHDSDRNYRN